MLRRSSAKRNVPALVPIRELSERHRARIRAHLLKLDEGDRYLRFGYAANDEQVVRYADSLDFERDNIFGIFNRRLELIAMAHLAYTDLAEHRNCAEFGVSVLKTARGLGLGTRLFARAMLHARNKGVNMMFIHALSENTAMLKIARNAGARVAAMARSLRPTCSCQSPAWTAVFPRSGATTWPRWTTSTRSRPSSSGPSWPMCRKSARACAMGAISLPLEAEVLNMPVPG